MKVWHHGSAIQPCKCPICRRHINLIIPSDDTQHQRNNAEARPVLEKVERYNHLYGGGSRTLMQRIQDLPFFIRRLLRELMDPQRSLPLVFRARTMFAMVLSGLYVLSPIDIIPEGFLGFVGLLDDFLIVLVVFLHLATIYRSLLLNRHGGGY